MNTHTKDRSPTQLYYERQIDILNEKHKFSMKSNSSLRANLQWIMDFVNHYIRSITVSRMFCSYILPEYSVIELICIAAAVLIERSEAGLLPCYSQ